jgi:hypothetical protein
VEEYYIGVDMAGGEVCRSGGCIGRGVRCVSDRLKNEWKWEV